MLMERRGLRCLLVGGAGVLVANALLWRRDSARALRCRATRRVLPNLPAAQPRVSMLVAAWNEADVIQRHLASVAALNYPDLEVVLSAGGQDGTYELARQHERPGLTVLLQPPGRGKQAALRDCLERASGEVIFLTDADCIVDQDSFERTVAPVLAGEAEAATGTWRPLAEQLRSSALAAHRWASTVYGAAQAPATASGIVGANAAVSRLALKQAGDFQDEVPSGTDYHLAKLLLKTGASIRHLPASEIESRMDLGLPSFARQQRRWLRNVVRLGPSLGARAEALACWRTSLLALGLLLAPLVCLLARRPRGLALWALVLLHGSVSKVRYLGFAYLLQSGLGRRQLLRCSLLALPMTLFELLVWAFAIVDYLRLRWEPRW
jgi:hypothetical protein